MGYRGSPVVAIAAIDAKAPISNDSHIPLTKPDPYIQTHNQGWWQKTINNILALKKKGDACHRRSTPRRFNRRPPSTDRNANARGPSMLLWAANSSSRRLQFPIVAGSSTRALSLTSSRFNRLQSPISTGNVCNAAEG